MLFDHSDFSICFILLSDTPPFLFFATEAEVFKAQRVPPESTAFEQWRIVQQLNITGVTALDVDIFESKFYWINSVEKVSAPSVQQYIIIYM